MFTINEIKIIFEKLKNISFDSEDIHTKVGCFIAINEKEIIRTCNSFPNGLKLQEDRLQRPEKYNWFICAERNAIYKASKFGISLNGSNMYINRPPGVCESYNTKW